MQKSIKVKPKSVQQKISEEADVSLSISLKPPPVDGEADAELIKSLVRKLAVPKSKITIKLGYYLDRN